MLNALLSHDALQMPFLQYVKSVIVWMLFNCDSCVFLKKLLFSFSKGKESHNIFLFFLVDIQMKEVWDKVGSQSEICF